MREYLSKRVQSIVSGEDNPFMQLLSLAAQYPKVVALGRGDPDLPTPQHIIDAAMEALRAGETKYTPPVGLLALREAVAERYNKNYGLSYDPQSEVIITAGTQQAIFVCMSGLLDPGDEIIIPEPYYACYAESAKMAGATVVAVKTDVGRDFEVDADAIAAAVTPKTKMIALLSPSNPSGTMVPAETMRKIAAVAEKHDLLVLCDELYENILYDGKTPTCFATMPGMRERAIIFSGCSKAYAMTGMRIGFMVGPRMLLKPLSVPHHSMVICANTVAQYSAIAALRGPQDFLTDYRDRYDVRRQIVMEELSRGGVPFARPAGGFFVFADVRRCGMDSFGFCKGLLQATQVQVFPGTMYGEGMDGFVRISFLAEAEELRQAMVDFVAYYQSQCK